MNVIKLGMLAAVILALGHSLACVVDRASSCTCELAEYRVVCTGLEESMDEVLPFRIPTNTRILSLRKNWVLENVSLRQAHLAGLNQLVKFDISKNRVSQVETGTFQFFPYLNTVDLSRNRIRVLEPDVFGISLPNLERLILAENRLVVLMNNNFESLMALKELDLSGNPLLYVSQRAFTGLKQLKILRMSGCNLTGLPADALSSLVNLRVLDLKQFPFITSLQSKSFVGNVKLGTLIIDQFSDLSSFGLSPTTFVSLSVSLHTLQLTSCNLTDIPELAMRQLYNLRELYLSNNYINVLRRNDLANLNKLTKIDLSNNGLMQVENLALRTNVNLVSIDFSNNRLITLARNSFPPKLSNVKNLILSGNNWSCDCRLQWVASCFSAKNGEEPVVCSNPLSAQNQNLTDLFMTNLTNCQPPKINKFVDRNVMEVLAGENFNLPCAATETPDAIIKWYTPARSYLQPQTTSVSRGSLDNDMRVRYARINDDGIYHCVAATQNGDDVRSVAVQVKGASNDMSEIQPVPDTSGNPIGGCTQATQGIPLLRIVLIGVLACVSCVGLLASFFLAVWGYNNRRRAARLQRKIEACREDVASGDETLVARKRKSFADKKVTFGQSKSSGYGSGLNSPITQHRPPEPQRTTRPQR